MMETVLELFLEFFKIGAFAVGGGPATLPFLMDLAERKPWYGMEQLTDMIAISESTPGPLGLNMSTYAGFQAMGVWGGLVASFGLVLPSVVIIMLIAKFLENFSENSYVKAAFRGIRPAVTALIGAAVFRLCSVSLFIETESVVVPAVGSMVVAVVVFGLLQLKRTQKLHPALWFLAGAAVGVVFRL
ncbi:MAG: chromate transporter [Clostridium sp.]|nr:chromate transporter [Acetatifactor muris]MCM1527221.1 chromate transporter [Bacteroides sp.]MCM1562454.1 chromate transporter [Clostridium sp.]